MMRIFTPCCSVYLVTALAAVAFASAANATSVAVQADTVNSEDSWESGGLLFTNFSFDFGNVSNTSGFTLTIQGASVTLTGPMRVQNLQSDDFQMSYQVSSVSSTFGITDVSFHTPASAVGSATSNRIGGDSSFDDGSSVEIASLATFATASTADTDASQAISPEMLLTVQAVASLRSGKGGSAEVTSISNSFTLVPEPASALMLALGLVGLATGSSFRRR
jgi:hypothetical protein